MNGCQTTIQSITSAEQTIVNIMIPSYNKACLNYLFHDFTFSNNYEMFLHIVES